jgi:phosphoglycolate phosphatase
MPVRLKLTGREVACRAIIFDKDGTLVDPTGLQTRLTRMRALRAAADAAVGSLQGASPEMSPRQAGNRPARSTQRDDELQPPASELVEQGAGRPAADEGALQMEEWPCGPGLLPGVADMLATLRSLGLRMAIATGDRRRRAEVTMDALGVGGHFAAIIGIDDVTTGKPAPDMVHAACERLGCAPEEVIVVGDSPADLMMGRAAGVAGCIGVIAGFSASERLGALADAVLPTVAALPDLLVPRK